MEDNEIETYLHPGLADQCVALGAMHPSLSATHPSLSDHPCAQAIHLLDLLWLGP
jgi:hypothetical protein